MCFQTNRDSQLWLGLVAFVIGAVALLQKFDLVPPETWGYLWPSILIVSGLKWMVARGSSDECSCDCDESSACEDCGGENCNGSCAVPAPVSKKSSKKKSRK